MRYSILFCLLIYVCCSFTSLAQCHIYSKTDQFDGSVTKWTKQVRIASDGISDLLKGPGYTGCSYKIFLNFICKNDKIVLAFTERYELCSCVPKSVSFKFTNGTILTKNNVRIGRAKTTVGYKGELYSYFDLTLKELQMLSHLAIHRFRVKEAYCSDHPVVEEDVAPKTARKVKESATCMLRNLN